MSVAAFAWYTAESWPKLLAVAADRSNLPDAHAEWERRATAQIAGLAARGVAVEKVPIDIDQLVGWCKQYWRPVDRNARAAFAARQLAARLNP